MSSVPLAALALRTPEPIDPLQQYGRVVQLKSLMDEQKIRQQQATFQQQLQPLQLEQAQTQAEQSQLGLQSEKAIIRAYNESGGDIQKAIPLARQYGAIPSDISKWQNDEFDRHAKLTKLHGEELDNAQKQTGLIGQVAGSLLQTPQPQRMQALQQLTPQLSAAGMDISKIPPDQLNNLLSDDYLKHLQIASLKTSEQLTQNREQKESDAKLPGMQADSAEKTAKMDALNAYLSNPKNAGKTEADFEIAQAGRKSGAEANARLGAEKNLEDYKYKLQMNAGNAGTNGPLPPAQEATVQAILDGRASPPSSFALKTPYWQGIMGAVYSRDPQFSEQRAQLRKDFTVGKHSNEINAINTAMGHVGVLGDAIDALNNGNIKALNGLANSLGVQVGNDAATTFNTIVHRVGPELSKAYIGAGGSAGERGADEKDFDPSLGPKQLKSNVAITAKLLRSKIGALENQWNQNAPQGQNFEQRFITPEAKQQLDKWSPSGGGQFSVTDPHGTTHTFKSQVDADAFKKAAGIQ